MKGDERGVCFSIFFAAPILALSLTDVSVFPWKILIFSCGGGWWSCWGFEKGGEPPHQASILARPGLAVILCLRIDDARNGLSCRVRMTKTGQQS